MNRPMVAAAEQLRSEEVKLPEAFGRCDAAGVETK